MFLQQLAAIIQLWIGKLPSNVRTCQVSDGILGLLTFIGLTLQNTCAQQVLPNPVGIGASNPLINFWHNVQDGLLAQQTLLQNLISQGFLTSADLNLLTASTISALSQQTPPNPTVPVITVVLKIIVGTLSIYFKNHDGSSRSWALLFLLYFLSHPTLTCNLTDLEELFAYLFNQGRQPVKICQINDPCIPCLVSDQNCIPAFVPTSCCEQRNSCESKPKCKTKHSEDPVCWFSHRTKYVNIAKFRVEKASEFILKRLANDAKTLMKSSSSRFDMCTLCHIFQKMLLVSMFVDCPNACCDTENTGGKKC